MPPKLQKPTKPQALPEECAVSHGIVELLAAEGGGDASQTAGGRFRMVLYTGEVMANYYDPQLCDLMSVVLDVSGFKPKRTAGWPAMVDHWQRAGTLDAVNTDAATGTITASGRLLKNEDDMFPAAARASSILQQGHALQCSGRWVPPSDRSKIEMLASGTTAKVNGKTITGPVQIWREFNMREGSFVDLGRDETTAAELAASMSEAQPKESPPMPTNLALLASLSKLVGADHAIDLLSKQPDATDLLAFTSHIEASFTDLKAKLTQATTDLTASAAKVTKLEADLAAALKAPVVKIGAGDPAEKPRDNAELNAADPATLSDADLHAKYEASADLKGKFDTKDHYRLFIRSGCKAAS